MDSDIIMKRLSVRTDIVSCIGTVVEFLEDAPVLLDQNLVFKEIVCDCKDELLNNTCYRTLAADDFDCSCREFDIYLKYILMSAENVIAYVRDIRKFTDSMFLYTIYNFVESRLDELRRSVVQNLPGAFLDEYKKEKK